MTDSTHFFANYEEQENGPAIKCVIIAWCELNLSEINILVAGGAQVSFAPKKSTWWK